MTTERELLELADRLEEVGRLWEDLGAEKLRSLHAQVEELNRLLSFERMARESAVADERERCEVACEEVARKYQMEHNASAENIADECVSAIRARSDQ